MSYIDHQIFLFEQFPEFNQFVESRIEFHLKPHPHFKMQLIEVQSEDWQIIAEFGLLNHFRWVAGWAEMPENDFWVNSLLEKQGYYLLFRCRIKMSHPQLPSQATIYPAANRSERHTQDMFGIEFNDHPDSRRWTRHQAWSKHQFPLRREFSVAGQPVEITPADKDYPFMAAQGSGVYEIPVGPVHAGIIEPGHFRFQAVGETILNLEERLAYVHKGIEKIAESRTPEQLLKLAARVSGDTAVGHSWAAAQAMEQAAGLEIPLRAALIRGILAERERIVNHLGDIGAICNDVAFSFAQMQFTRLRELWLRTHAQWFGHRLLMDTIIVGGVASDLSVAGIAAIQQQINELRQELAELIPALDMNSSLEDRLQTTGYLTEVTAKAFGSLGYVGRASGQTFDARHDIGYSPYDQAEFHVILENQGDIASRVWVRIKEINVALKLIQQFCQRLTEITDPHFVTPWVIPKAGAEGLGTIEGWRGEIICFVRFTADNRISRFYPRDPSILNWPTLEKIVLNNIVPDFPVCNKSVNGSYSANDL